MQVSAASLEFTAAVNFVENAVSFVAQGITIPLMAHLVLLVYVPRLLLPTTQLLRPVSMSASMFIYLSAHVILAIASMPSYIYAYVNYRPAARLSEIYSPA